MSKINSDFDIPYYIFEELIEYISFKCNGIEKASKLESIYIFLNTAVINKKLSSDQAEYIKKTFCN